MSEYSLMIGDATCAVTTGRISVFAEPSAETKAAGKKGGEWVYATHDLADVQDVLKCIEERMITGTCNACHGNDITCHITDEKLCSKLLDVPVQPRQSFHYPHSLQFAMHKKHAILTCPLKVHSSCFCM